MNDEWDRWMARQDRLCRILRWGAVAGLGLVALAVARPSEAVTGCDTKERVQAVLWDQYGERLVATGFAVGGLMSLFASDERDTWTITITMPDGQMCLVAAGSDFYAVPVGEPT